jgi:uncharacterized protein (TIGR02246 family)
MRNFGLGVLVTLVFSAGAVSTAQKPSDDQVLREARDRAEIEDLMWRYARALDTGNGEAYAAVYTPDGQFGTGANATKGREALMKLAGGARTPNPAGAAAPARPPMYHMHANHASTFTDKDHARLDAYYITAIAAGGPDTPLRVAAVGRSIDELVRLNGKWLIKVRNVQPMD